MKIICINGQGGVGKDSFVFFCGSPFSGIYNYSMIDGVKNIATLIGWDGGKGLKDRKFLSDLKDLVDDYNDYSFRNVLDHLKFTFFGHMDKLNKDYGELMKNKKGEDEGEFEVAIDKLQSQVKKLRTSIVLALQI